MPQNQNTPTNRSPSRRTLLRAASASAATLTIVPRHVLGGANDSQKFVPPSEKVNIALVGAGGQGRTNLRALFNEPDAQVIALADPAEKWDLEPFYFKGLAGRGPVAAEIEKTYAEKTPNFKVDVHEDFRVMLEKNKDIDAVLCATPDHLHAYVSVLCMRAGKHVYCEKPLTHNIAEARLVSKVAKETGLATQMGNQGHSREGIRQTCEWIWDGAIGPVREVHSWVAFTGRWNKTLTGVPKDAQPVPQGLNWDLWIGPRQPRPFHSAYAPVTWRDFWQFGCGAMGDFGCHDLDAPMWALDLARPTTIESLPAGNTDAEIAPHGEICYFHYPERTVTTTGPSPRKITMPPLRVTFYSGGLKPPRPEELGNTPLPDRGILFIGDKGKLLAEGAGGAPRLLPFSETPKYTKPEKTIPRVKGHHADWLNACKGNGPASSNFDYGAKLTEITLLGLLSLRTRKKIYWDYDQMRATNFPDADPIIHGTYRKGWELA